MSNILAFAESWAGYSTNTSDSAINSTIMFARWTTIDNGGVFSINSDGAGKYATVGASVHIYKTITHQSGFTIGFRARISSAGNRTLLSIYNNGSVLGSMAVNIDGTMSAYASNNLIATSNSVIHSNIWYYYELSITLSGTSNINVAAILKVNGEQLINGNANSGINNTSLTSQSTTVNRFSINGDADFRDIVVNNGGSQFDGDVKILGIRPNADRVSNWVTNTGTVHYTLVNDPFCDFDATYVYSTATGSQDIWDWEDIPAFSGVIKGIQISIMARKDDEGSKSFEIVTGTSGTETQSPEFYLADDYVAYYHCQDNDPATTLPYTVVGFNAKSFGIKLIK